MFNIGGGEFLVIALIALIVLGPQRLPDAARQVGKAMGELRRLSSGFQSEMRDAFGDVDSTPAQASRRDALAPAPGPDATSRGPVSDAVAAVSQQSTPRRAPLQASPAADATTSDTAPAARPAKKAPVAKQTTARSSPATKKAPPVTGAAPAKKAPAKKSGSTKGSASVSRAPQPRRKGS